MQKTNTNFFESYTWVVLRNVFNLINIFVIPLVGILLYFEKYKEVFVIFSFAVVNSLVSMWNEIKIKKRLDQIRLQFAPTVKVVRNGEKLIIPVSELVVGDVVELGDAEGVPADGELVEAESLLVDESLLTGESDYIPKSSGDVLYGGSFVVTGRCVYKVSAPAAQGYMGKLTSQARKYDKRKSKLQKVSDRLTVFFVVCAVLFGLVTYISAKSLGYPTSEAVIPLVSVVSLIIPQTLIFLFTLSFSITVLRLSKEGALIQYPPAVETLANIDYLCLDKTGTITSNQVNVTGVRCWSVSKEEVAGYFNYTVDKVVGKNKTFQALADFFVGQRQADASGFENIPFTSKSKIAIQSIKVGNKWVMFVYGASSEVEKYVDHSILPDVRAHVAAEEDSRRRVVVGVVEDAGDHSDLSTQFTSKKVWVASLVEELNPGISEILKRFHNLGVELRIITGDSLTSTLRVLEEIDIKWGKAVDLSQNGVDIKDLVNGTSIYTRAKPEDKLKIIQALQQQGKLVGMVGDGVNDVLAMKKANLAIAMEIGTKISRDVADIILLGNNFKLMPQIVFEGQNVMHNLKFMNKLFLAKTGHAIVFTAICAAAGLAFPLLPTSLLVYSFLATSLPSYVVAFLRRKVSGSREFWGEVLPIAVLGSVISAAVSFVAYQQVRGQQAVYVNTFVMYATFVYATFFAVHQLFYHKYLQKWWEGILSAIAIIGIGAGASLIWLLNLYYDVTSLSLNDWGTLIGIGAVGFLAYLLGFVLLMPLGLVARLQKV